MNKGKNNRVKLEVRPRSYGFGTYSSNQKKYSNELNRRDRLVIKSVISIIILLGIFTLKNMDGEFSKGITGEISKAISYQVQWNSLFKSDILSTFEKTLTSFLGDKSVQVDTDSLTNTFVEPVKGHITSGFQEKTHPVFNTKIEPRGVEYSVFEDQTVLVSSDGVVLNIMDSTYQGKRVVVQHKDDYKTVYDGVETCQVQEEQSVKKGDTIGSITANEEIPKLFYYEVWKDNTAVDPNLMFSSKE